MSWDHSNYSIVEIGQNTEKSPGDSKRLAVTQIPVEDFGAFGTVIKGMIKVLENLEKRGRVDTIQTTVVLRSARILRRVLEAWGDLLSLSLQKKTIS